MYAITGITGNVGGATARALLAAGQPVRAIVRDVAKGAAWVALGCEVAVADIEDAQALAAAFAGADGLFLMTPPNFDPEPDFPQIRRILAAARAALMATRPGKLVYLSTVGAQVREPNLLNNALIMEEGLGDLPIPTAFLRPAWFMENAAWDVAAARTGTIPTFLQPLDHPIPMIATADIGRVAAELLTETWTGRRIVELEARRRYSADNIASGFADVLGHLVRMAPVPRADWDALFREQGARNPMPRMRMLDGFNAGWIDFERAGAEARLGETPLEAVLAELVGRASA